MTVTSWLLLVNHPWLFKNWSKLNLYQFKIENREKVDLTKYIEEHSFTFDNVFEAD